MPSFRLNFANIQGCPAPAKVLHLMERFGLPESEEYGVLSCQASESGVFCTIVRKTTKSLLSLDRKSKEITAVPVEQVTVFPFGIRPALGRLETYAGSAAGVEQVAVFLSGCLALPTLVGEIELDLLNAIDKLAKNARNFQLRAIRTSDYCHNSYMIGPYAPKFLDSEHGKDFLTENIAAAMSASVRFAAPKGRATVTFTPKAQFGYSCNEDDQANVQGMLRKLVTA